MIKLILWIISVQKGEGRSARLDILVSEAERRVVDLTAAVLNGSSGNTAMSSNQQKVKFKQILIKVKRKAYKI